MNKNLSVKNMDNTGLEAARSPMAGNGETGYLEPVKTEIRSKQCLQKCSRLKYPKDTLLYLLRIHCINSTKIEFIVFL